MKYKKERGQYRKIEKLLVMINKITPYQNVDQRYEHFHVPSDPFISSPKTSSKIKTAFCKAWLNKTVEIMNQKPESVPFCKVVACINECDLWESQIVIFYDEAYYESFWKRDTFDQTWIPVQDNHTSFSAGRNIKNPLNEKGYYERINDGEIKRQSILWFYGDVF